VVDTANTGPAGVEAAEAGLGAEVDSTGIRRHHQYFVQFSSEAHASILSDRYNSGDSATVTI
jgi:hypothetical protein